jgi:hypothetical protein
MPTLEVELLFPALADHLQELGAKYEVVVFGSAALVALGLVSRPIRDVDLMAQRDGDRLLDFWPMPDALASARDRVARDLGLPAGWLVAALMGPVGNQPSFLELGLPPPATWLVSPACDRGQVLGEASRGARRSRRATGRPGE